MGHRPGQLSGTAGRTAVLVANREFPFTLAVTNYEIVEVGLSSAAGIFAHLPVPQAAIQEGQEPPFSVRIVPDGSGYCVVSARRDIVRITTVPRTGTPTVATNVRLGGAGSALPGLYRLDLASARLDGTWLSLALTAYLNHPGVGPVSVGALLRAGLSFEYWWIRQAHIHRPPPRFRSICCKS